MTPRILWSFACAVQHSIRLIARLAEEMTGLRFRNKRASAFGSHGWSGGGVTYYVEQARERSNARMIVIDPRYNDTAAGHATGCWRVGMEP